MMLATGTKAPDFTLADQRGKAVSLSDFKGKKVVLYFYAEDDTKGCTNQAQRFAELQPEFADKNAVIIGIRIRQSLIRPLPKSIICPLPSWRIRIKKLSICTVYGAKRNCTVKP